jgi:uncharacterized protein
MTEVKIANPGPLGLSGFALTTFILMLIKVGLITGAELGVVIGLAVAYGGLAQFVAGMWEFRSGNTFGATAFTSFGAFWLSFAVLVTHFGGASATGAGVGWYEIGWGIFTGLMALGSFRTNLATAAVFVLLCATFVVLGLGDLQNTSTITHIGGYLGIATAAVAWYTALAGILKGVNNEKDVLPVFPLTR